MRKVAIINVVIYSVYISFKILFEFRQKKNEKCVRQSTKVNLIGVLGERIADM